MNLLADLYNAKLDKITVLSNLKVNPYRQAKKYFKIAISHPIGRSMICKSLFPKTPGDLRNSRLLNYSNNFEGELAYAISILTHSAPKINEFIKWENKIEGKILRSDGSVFTDLSEVKIILGYSLWLLENQYAATQRFKGIEENWIQLSELSKSLTDPLAQVFNSFLSKKIEPNLSILEYKRSLEGLIKPLYSGEGEFCCFRLGNFLVKDYEEYAFISFLESTSSAVDIYLTTLNIIGEIICDDTHDFYPTVLEALTDLNKVINDPRLNRMLEVAGLCKVINYNIQIVESVRLYCDGLIEEQIAYLERSILSHPEQIDLYEMYINSLVDERRSYEHFGAPEFSHEILKNLYDLIKRTNSYEVAKEELLKICLGYSQFKFAKQLLGLVASITGLITNKGNHLLDFFTFNAFAHPAIILRIGKKHIENISTNGSSILQLYRNTAMSDMEALKTTSFSQKAIVPLVANAYFINKDYQNCIDYILQQLDLLSIGQATLEELNFYLFYSYVYLEDYRAAVELTVDCYLGNQYSLSKLNVDLLIAKILDNEDKLSSLIDLPILYYIQNLDDYYKYVALDNYLKSKEISRPSSLLETSSKTIFLLKHVCTIEVLTKFYMDYENFKDILNERVEVCKLLTIIDKENIEFYFEEITKQNQREKIKSIIDTFNKGKIRLNLMSIKKSKDYNLENSFNRFLKLHEFSEGKNLKLIDVMGSISTFINEINLNSSRLQDASFLSFKSIWIELIDYTLFSKEHGLDGDLSTGFRHGILENQIRSVFIKNNLIAQKIDSNKYGDVTYWHNYSSNTPNDRLQIEWQNAIREFSKSIDEEIQSLVVTKIQIVSNRYNEKKQGLFNYDFTDEYIWLFYRGALDEITSFEQFLEYCLLLLRTITQEKLSFIRKYIQSSLNEIFQNQLDKLKERSSLIFNWSDFQSDVSVSIMNTKNQIANELDSISEWFNLSDPNIDEALDMQSIVESSVELINISYPHFKIQPTITCEVRTLFPAYRLFIDIFTILFSNIIEHSKLSANDLLINVDIVSKKVENNRDILEIKIVNNFSSILDISQVYEKFQTIKDHWLSLDSGHASKEGGSGYPKIKRILTHAISSFGNSFDFKISELNLEIILTLDYEIQ